MSTVVDWSPVAKAERNNAMLDRHEAGASYRQIAKEFSVSESRVRQVVRSALKRLERDVCPTCHGSGWVRR